MYDIVFMPRFLSTLSLRRATPPRVASLFGRCYFYPRSPCGERLCSVAFCLGAKAISIHALLAESDSDRANFTRKIKPNFYPRSPCGERLFGFWMALNRLLFLSTLSLRRATVRCFSPAGCWRISIHALLAESDVTVLGIQHKVGISIHALLAESDGVTVIGIQHKVGISIHALLAESDLDSSYGALAGASISIHALLAESDARLACR